MYQLFTHLDSLHLNIQILLFIHQSKEGKKEGQIPLNMAFAANEK